MIGEMNAVYANIRRALQRALRQGMRPVIAENIPADPLELERSRRERERVYAKYGYLLFLNPYR